MPTEKEIEIFMKKKAKLEKTIGEEFSFMVHSLTPKEINFRETSKRFAETAVSISSQKLEMLLEYRANIERLNDPTIPQTPFYYDLQNCSERKIEETTLAWHQEWSAQRESKYKSCKNVIYKKDYTNILIAMPKYPVVGHNSLNVFLQTARHHIEKSFGKESPDFDDLTFIQPMYGQDKNGTIVRFARVVEIIPCEKTINGKKYPTFDFSVSIKVMPDDDLNHSSCLLRLDSKTSGHVNVTPAICNDKVFHLLYTNSKNEDLHIHYFDRRNQLIYLGRPLSSNTIPLNTLIGLASSSDHDTKGIPELIFNLTTDEESKKRMLVLRKTLHISKNQLNGEKAMDRKQSWLSQFSALKQSIEFLDYVLEIYPEQTLEVVQKQMQQEYIVITRESFSQLHKPSKTAPVDLVK